MSLSYSPTIDDLLADSLIQTVMRADHVEPQELQTLLHGVANRIGGRERALQRPPAVFVSSAITAGRRPRVGMQCRPPAGRGASVTWAPDRRFAASGMTIKKQNPNVVSIVNLSGRGCASATAASVAAARRDIGSAGAP